jgi:hypothetical protein
MLSGVKIGIGLTITVCVHVEKQLFGIEKF